MATAKGKRLREPAPRDFHVSAQVSGRVAIYNGRTREATDDRRLEVFDPLREEWDSKETTGESLSQGLLGASCAAINNDIFTYGGWNGWRYLNELRALRNLCRREKCSVASGGGSPMPKSGSAMVACGKDLVVAGGHGMPDGPAQPGSSFIEDTRFTDGRVWTNEIHRLREGMRNQ